MDLIAASFRAGLLEEENIWFFDNDIQALCKMDVRDYQMEIITKYKGDSPFSVRYIYSFKDKFYFLNSNSRDILEYDRNKHGKDDAFFLHESGKKDLSVHTAMDYQGFLFFFPYDISKKINCFDIEKQRYVERHSFEEILGKRFTNRSLGCACLCGDNAYFVVKGTPFYLKYHLLEGCAELFRCENENSSLGGICFDGKHIWLSQTHSSDLICDGRQTLKVSEGGTYSWLRNLGKYVAVLPEHSDRLVLIRKNTCEISVFNLPLTEMEKKFWNGCILTDCCESGDDIILFPNGVRDLLVLHEKTKRIERVKLQCEGYKKGYLERCKKQNDCISENSNVKLRNFLDFIQEREVGQ